MKKVLKRIISSIIWILLLTVIAYNIYSYITIKVMKKDLVSIKGYALLEVVSGSMEPTIKIGDLIIINQNVDNFKKDDIITFKDVNNSFVTHRIVGIENDKIVTKGDANNSQDEPINKDRIVGKYITKISNLGTFMRSLKSPFVLVMILVIGLLVVYLISTDKKGLPKDITEEEREFLEFKNNKKNISNIPQEEKVTTLEAKKINHNNVKNKNGNYKRKNNNHKKKNKHNKKKNMKNKKKRKNRK